MCASAEPSSVETLTVGGRSVSVARRSGTGRPLLVCNDFGLDHRALEPFCAALARPSIRFDGPGIGGVRGRASFQGMAAVAADLAELHAALGLARVDVLGVGWGGLLAQRFARDHADHVGRLVLVATASGALMLPGRLSSLRRLAWSGAPAGAVLDGRDARQLFGGRRAEECDAVAAALHRVQAPTRRAHAAQLYAMAGFSSLPWLHRLAMPTLVLAADDDQIVPLVNARVLALLIPDARLSVMRGSGHWLLLERAEEAARRIEAFLDTPHPLQPGGEAV